jgi:hypothetical protein
MKKINPMTEVAAILGRKLTGIERLQVRAKTSLGMVNPYDIINTLKLVCAWQMVTENEAL